MKKVGAYEGSFSGKKIYLSVFAEPLLIDDKTPVGIFESLQGSARALLESADPLSKFSEFSFICGNPLIEFIFKDGTLEVQAKGVNLKIKTNDPLAPLKEASQFLAKEKVNEKGLFGGLVGYLGFESYKYFEPAAFSKVHQNPYPESYFFLPEFVILFDHKTHMGRLFITELKIEGNTLNENEPVYALKLLKQLIFGKNEKKENPPLAPESFGRPVSSFSYEDFVKAVVKAKEYIFEGDAYQIVISQRFSYPELLTPFQLFRYLRISNPSPYMFYFPAKGITLVGASPEPLLKVESGIALTRPIAGTRRRGKTLDEDENLAKELSSDEKELCEHTMLVDLARNDLNRVCKPSTVRLSKAFEVERYSHVMHLVSEVVGELKEEVTAVDALKAVFPAGTVSGAPKIRATQIITELEPVARGPYAGAFGYLNFNGDLDTCIVIRTAFIDSSFIHVQTGAGIVRDSVPEFEFQETLNKAKGIFEVLEKGVIKHASFD